MQWGAITWGLRALLCLTLLLGVGACRAPASSATRADVIVVGGGIAGLAAALEAESHGARVLVIEANSMAGGHAVRAGGFALVDTPLQRAKGYRDSPDIAFRDMMAWGEDADAWWVRHFVENSREQIYDWLTGMGAKFVVVLDTPEDTVPRFHFTAGGAVNAVLPMIRAALGRERISFAWNNEVIQIVRRDGRITGVVARNARDGTETTYEAGAVILTTGGYQNNLQMVRRTWNAAVPAPGRLLAGAGEYARGSGLELVEPFGAAFTRLDHQVTFVNGLPDPRDPSGEHGLLTQNPAAIWVDATGRRFTNEAAPSKITDRAVLMLSPATHWLVFDAEGLKKLTIRGAAWMTASTVRSEILANRALVKQADDIATLAEAAGLPPDALVDTVERFNRFVEQGMDTDFGRIGPATPAAQAIRKPPFYAVQLYPMTRKSMGGLTIDHEARVLGGAGQWIRGLFAAGEVTGVAGINGRFGGSGTFLGPSVLTGRIAGRSAVALVLGSQALESRPGAAAREEAAAPPAGEEPPARAAPVIGLAELPALVARQRRGYWHFEVSHALVVERKEACADCHTAGWSMRPAVTRAERLVQLQSCTRCH